MPRLPGTFAVLSVTLLAHASAAYGVGASASATGDPPTGSPAGAVYELPLERGRAEAAPKGGGGTAAPGAEGGEAGANGAAAGGDGGSGQGGGAAGGENGGEEGSLYRSENNFGSSSHVPGTRLGTGGDSAAGSDRADSEAAANLAQGREAAQVADSGNTSPAANFALLGAIALIALGSGVFIGRAGRLSTGS
jgi:hypothetical protein